MTNRIEGATHRNYQWDRVQSTAPPAGQEDRRLKNKLTFKSNIFTNACLLAGVDVTTRQASKFNRRVGAAFKAGFKKHHQEHIQP